MESTRPSVSPVTAISTRCSLARLTKEDTNIRLAGFATEAELERRLAAADIHLISLRRGWEGIVVPSKFFGALAIGRPVLFSGPEESCIARWIADEKLGCVLDDASVAALHFIRELGNKRKCWNRRGITPGASIARNSAEPPSVPAGSAYWRRGEAQ